MITDLWLDWLVVVYCIFCFDVGYLMLAFGFVLIMLCDLLYVCYRRFVCLVSLMGCLLGLVVLLVWRGLLYADYGVVLLLFASCWLLWVFAVIPVACVWYYCMFDFVFDYVFVYVACCFVSLCRYLFLSYVFVVCLCLLAWFWVVCA